MAEHILYGKRKLCFTEVINFTDFQGIGRDPLYKRFDSVYSVIEKNIEPQYRDFLAHPIYSDDDQISWYVREWSSAPCAYNDLPENDKIKYASIKKETVDAYKRVIKNLTGEDKQILTGALKYVMEDFIFCYDDKVVLVAWGMTLDLHEYKVNGIVVHDLKIQNNHKIRFVVGENGSLPDRLAGVVSRPDGFVLSYVDLPKVTPKKGYDFRGWEPNPLGVKVNGSLTFSALYDKVEEDYKIEEEGKSEEPEMVYVSFIAGDGGKLEGTTEYTIEKGTYIDISLIPIVSPSQGFSFAGWDVQPESQLISDDVTFYATFKQDSAKCKFDSGEHGSIEGVDVFSLPYGSIIDNENIPIVKAEKGYDFIGWDKSPYDFILEEDTVFTAQYEKTFPWYKRWWMWFVGKGCLKWLLWLLLFILILFILSWFMKSCDDTNVTKVEPIARIETPDGSVIDDNGPIRGVVGEDGELPVNDRVVAPIVGDDGETPPIESNPGVPDVVANRLNIYFDNADVNLERFISDMSQIYSESQCEVIGFDKNVPMIQVLVPENMRDQIRKGLNEQLPNYEFFIVDESIFSIVGGVSSEAANVGWHLRAIEVKKGWNITNGDPNVIVAVVDDGIDASHDMFKNRIVNPYNVFTQDNKLSVGQGHGTHVAGLAVGSNDLFDRGISGIAPNCKLMPVQVFDNGLCTFSSVTSGIMYAIHNGADVVNVSIGPKFKGLDILPIRDQDYIAKNNFKNEERVWKKIIKIANEHNVIVVFAVGNDNILANIPPENRTNLSINVAAVDEKIKETDFTNYGNGSNISAPGKGIISSVPVNDYAVFDGTSMAAPIVSGTVALMKSCKPDISVSEILHILQSTGKQVVGGKMPSMVQVDDALVALTTGAIPDRTDEENPFADKSESEDKSAPKNGDAEEQENESSSEDNDVLTEGVKEPDYESIRRLIEEYRRKISELEDLLPENKNN